MAVFFTLVGLEVKKELFEGSLSSYKKAIFPAIAAVGGMIVPAIIYWAINQNHPEYHNGWQFQWQLILPLRWALWRY